MPGQHAICMSCSYAHDDVDFLSVPNIYMQMIASAFSISLFKDVAHLSVTYDKPYCISA